ncbi:putative aspartic proteinase GIP2 [Sesamum alatum]|uniref:Aspartic proteinase GIP2 n=1 Tax=Sesamum alatum TaxID=300844 RepID=A0AAE2CKP0_9LAMI|nr:putative aspartic proteinase GIP2 [Sesamum alatum]
MKKPMITINLMNLFILFLIFIPYEASAQPYTTLVAPVKKDAATSLYTIILNSNERYVVDLSAPFSWQRCPLPNYRPVACMSTECIQAQYLLSPSNCLLPYTKPTRRPCTCMVTPINPRTESCSLAQLISINLTISWTNGANPTTKITFSDRYLSCAPASLFNSLPRGIVGLASLSWAPLALPPQFSPPLLGVSRKFAMCLPSTSSGNGVIFFGDGPYNLLPPTKFSLCFPSSGLGKLSIGGPFSSTISTMSKSLKATPLIVNPVSTAPAFTVGDPSDEYFIDVKSIRVGRETLSVKNSYFSIDKDGVGGTKFSTIQNFTALHNSIYKPLTRAFTKAASDMKIKSVAAVEPFRACFSSDSISRTPAGPSVPTIDLVLPGNDIYWRIDGANSMVEVDERRMCLAFVDGGSNPRTSVVIGAHQLEENFLEFDLVSSQLKFSSSLLV